MFLDALDGEKNNRKDAKSAKLRCAKVVRILLGVGSPEVYLVILYIKLFLDVLDGKNWKPEV
jgi:hypothetical protein